VTRGQTDGGLPRYTRWADVPAGLYTRTQLGRLDPPRRPAPDAQPRAQALYHGNRYAPLFHLDDTVVKPAATEAQRAAAARARELQRVCRWCGHIDDEPLRRGRLCERCHDIREVHARHRDARREAARILRPTTVAAAVVTVADGRLNLALVAAAGDECLGRWQVDPNVRHAERAELLAAVHEALRQAGALHSKTTPVGPGGSMWTHEWDDVVFWSTGQQRAVQRLGVADPELDARSAYPDDGDGRPDYDVLDAQREQWRRTREAWPWLVGLGGTVQTTYARWWGEYTETGNAMTVSLRWDVPLPGAGGNRSEPTAARVGNHCSHSSAASR
jgi:hypothetical protein